MKIAEITNRVVKAVLIPRSRLDYIATRDEIKNVGIYFLFGETADRAKPLAYIGEAEDCLERIKQHNRSKEYWNHAVVMVSKIGAFTKSHAKYLEYLAVKDALDTNRYELDNSTNPAKPFVTESMEADLLDSFETVKILLSTLGYPVFDKVSRETSTQKQLFVINARNTHAEGNLVDDGFVVFSGSEASIDTTPSCNRYVVILRNQLIESKILVAQDRSYIFQQDYIFNSPSTAGGVVVGRSINGWKEWKDTNGITLDELKRKQM